MPAEEGRRRIAPAYIHAFEKLGFLLTEQNRHLFPNEDVAAWNQAVVEGEVLYGRVEDDQGDEAPD